MALKVRVAIFRVGIPTNRIICSCLLDYHQHILLAQGTMAVILALVLRKLAIKPMALLTLLSTILRFCDAEHRALARADEDEASPYRRSRNEWTFRSA